MNGISISIIELLIKGIPETLLMILALHIFTHTKINWKKYFMLSLTYIIVTYLIRMLPIQLGVNTMLSILIMVLLFHIAYRGQPEKTASVVISAVIILIIIMIAEVINISLLNVLFGEAKTLAMLSEDTPIIKSISTIPSTLFTAVFVFIGYLILKQYGKRKLQHGETGK